MKLFSVFLLFIVSLSVQAQDVKTTNSIPKRVSVGLSLTDYDYEDDLSALMYGIDLGFTFYDHPKFLMRGEIELSTEVDLFPVITKLFGGNYDKHSLAGTYLVSQVALTKPEKSGVFYLEGRIGQATRTIKTYNNEDELLYKKENSSLAYGGGILLKIKDRVSLSLDKTFYHNEKYDTTDLGLKFYF